MKNKILKTLSILIFVSLLVSCNKNDVSLTSGQQIGKELQQIIKDNYITAICIQSTDHKYPPVYYTTDFEIRNSMLRYEDEWYNLDYLAYSYLYGDFDNQNLVILYFGYDTDQN